MSTNPLGGPAATPPVGAAPANTPYDSITINGKPAKIVNGEVQIPKGAKIEIKTHFDAGVLNQGPVDVTLSKSGGSAPATQAQLKKQWKMTDETFATPNGDPVPPHQMGGMRYENFSFTAPKTADGSGLTLTLSQSNRPEQKITFTPQAAQDGPVVASPALASQAAAPETAGFGGPHGGGGFGHGPGGFGHPGGFPHPGGFGGPGPGGFGWHRPIGRPWFNPWNVGWGAMPPGWFPGCEWNPAWGVCPPGYYVP